MTDDTLLAERLSLLVDAPGTPDWLDVRRRARRRPGRRAVLIAAAALALLIAAPAPRSLRRPPIARPLTWAAPQGRCPIGTTRGDC